MTNEIILTNSDAIMVLKEKHDDAIASLGLFEDNDKKIKEIEKFIKALEIAVTALEGNIIVECPWCGTVIKHTL